jgi:hypothetical protein
MSKANAKAANKPLQHLTDHEIGLAIKKQGEHKLHHPKSTQAFELENIQNVENFKQFARKAHTALPSRNGNKKVRQ